MQGEGFPEVPPPGVVVLGGVVIFGDVGGGKHEVQTV